MPSDCFQGINLKEMMIRQGQNMDQDLQTILQNMDTSNKDGQAFHSAQNMEQEIHNFIQTMETNSKESHFNPDQTTNNTMNSPLPADLQTIKVEAFVGNGNSTSIAQPHFSTSNTQPVDAQVVQQNQSTGNQVIQTHTLLNLQKSLIQPIGPGQQNNTMITQAMLTDGVSLQQGYDNTLNTVQVEKTPTSPTVTTIQVSTSSPVSPVLASPPAGFRSPKLHLLSPVQNSNTINGNTLGVPPVDNTVQQQGSGTVNSVPSNNMASPVQANNKVNIAPLVLMGSIAERLQQAVGTVQTVNSVNMSQPIFTQSIQGNPCSIQMMQDGTRINITNASLSTITNIPQSSTSTQKPENSQNVNHCLLGQNISLSPTAKESSPFGNQSEPGNPNNFLTNQTIAQSEIQKILTTEHIIMAENLLLPKNQKLKNQVLINGSDQTSKGSPLTRPRSVLAESINQLLSNPTPHSSNSQLNTPEPIFVDNMEPSLDNISICPNSVKENQGNLVLQNKIDIAQPMQVESHSNHTLHSVFKLSNPGEVAQLMFSETALPNNNQITPENAALQILTNTEEITNQGGDVNMRTPSMLERLLKGGDKSMLNPTEINVASNTNSPTSVSSPDYPADSSLSSPGSVLSSIDTATQSTLISKSERLHLDSDNYANNEEISTDLFNWPVMNEEEHEPNKARKCSRDADAPSSIVNQSTSNIESWFSSGMATSASDFVFTKFGADVTPGIFSFGSKSVADTVCTNILRTVTSLPSAAEKPTERVESSPRTSPQIAIQTPVQPKQPQPQPQPQPQTPSPVQPQTITRSHAATRRWKEPGLTQQFPSKARGYELRILDQPEEQHRARYLTEGSRGAVKNRSQQGHPVVQLVGYSEPVTLQVFVGCDTGRVRPHGFYQACKVAGKNSTPCMEKEIDGTTVIEIELTSINDMTASIDCVGILKLRNADVEQRIGITKAKKKSTRARLVFRVTLKRLDGMQQTLQICSTSVLCTQPIGQPEICKTSLSEGPVTGGQELFIIGKNFMKGTKVFFQEIQMEESNVTVTWEKEADIDKDLFQPNHIVCTIPEYPNKLILKPVTAQVVVNSAGKLSEPQAYMYKPESRKRG